MTTDFTVNILNEKNFLGYSEKKEVLIKTPSNFLNVEISLQNYTQFSQILFTALEIMMSKHGDFVELQPLFLSSLFSGIKHMVP